MAHHASDTSNQSATLFAPRTEAMSPQQRQIYATFELLHTLVDFCAAVAFIIGSILYFSPDLTTTGTWMFLIGSILFAVKPTLRLAREVAYVRAGKTGIVAERNLG